ncbi:lysoplasmalogenase [Streptomyces sp. NPDC002851]
MRSYGLRRALFVAFAVAVVVDLGSLLLDVELGHRIAKPLLMPLLAAWVGARGGSRLLLVALLFGCGGDVLLLFDADVAFLAGMASFAAGHVCYLVLFRAVRARGGALGRSGGGLRAGLAAGGSRVRVGLAAGYGLALVGTVALLWPDLPADLRIPVAGYSLLLTAMAFRATSLGWYAGVGGALFLLSDTLIATGVAEWPQLPRPDFWIMLTYVTAQALLAYGVMKAMGDDEPTRGRRG